MSRDKPSKLYTVTACAHCAHPGGQHFFVGGYNTGVTRCHLCPCEGWVEGEPRTWNDLMTREALHTRKYVAPTDAPPSREGRAPRA